MTLLIVTIGQFLSKLDTISNYYHKTGSLPSCNMNSLTLFEYSMYDVHEMFASESSLLYITERYVGMGYKRELTLLPHNGSPKFPLLSSGESYKYVTINLG